MITYEPIPEQGRSYSVSTRDVRVLNCLSSYNTSPAKTTTFVVPSAGSRQYDPFREVVSRQADTGGSWEEIRKSKQIKMTPMLIKNEHTENFLGSIDRSRWIYAENSIGNHSAIGSCKPCMANRMDYDLQWKNFHYLEQGDLTYWQDRFPNAPFYRILRDDVTNKVEAAKSQAYAQLFKQYDLGEEIYEFRESIRQIASLLNRASKILLDAKDAYKQYVRKFKRTKTKPVADSFSKWMEYRYGIMPIIYSIKDILLLMKEKGLFRTVRKRVAAPGSKIELDDKPFNYFYETGVASVEYSITAKGRWLSPELKIFDLINLNPFTTAARVYPFAFVVRWFININDALESWVKSFTTLASEYQACVAVRTRSDVEVFLYTRDELAVTSSPVHSGDNECGAGWYPFPSNQTRGEIGVHRIKLQAYTVNNYERYLYQPGDVRLVWNPFMDFRRVIDALALLFVPSKKALRSLLK